MVDSDHDVKHLIGHLFRHESGKMAAVLSRLFGFPNYETAEDIVQDTLLKAMTTWRFHGIPAEPRAWLYTVAKNKALDVLRKEKRLLEKQHELATNLQSEWTLPDTVNRHFLDSEIEDSQLRLIFACCHPSIPEESQIAFTLKTLCGLSVHEIAHGLLTSDDTIAKRIYRAKEKIRKEKISLDVPVADELNKRMEIVLKILYLLFNEGYNSSHPDQLIRSELCEDAIRLCLLLSRNKQTNSPAVNALLALMCYQVSRFEARLNQQGEIIILKDQDRTQWNKELIKQADRYFEASSHAETISSYHLEAAIASCHAHAASFDSTDWKRIAGLYDSLMIRNTSPVVLFNRAIAIGYAHSPQQGIEALLDLNGFESNHYYHTALGDFYCQEEYFDKALRHYHLARSFTESNSERNLLDAKISSITASLQQ